MEAAERIRQMEAEKLRLIERYLQLQDEADAVNERIYHLCVDIEIINQKIAQEKERERKAAATAKVKSQATSPPPGNGSSAAVKSPKSRVPRSESGGRGSGEPGELRGDATLDAGLRSQD